MARQSSESRPFALPHIRETFRLKKAPQANKVFYDIKFYPYHTGTLATPPIFAIVGDRETMICRPSLEKGQSVNILRTFQDLEGADQRISVLNSCSWNYVYQKSPLICVAGPSGKVKVLNALTGELMTTMIGHGAEINDLSTHPLYPWILASASGDHSIRIWDLRRRMERGENACLIICGQGHGHKEGILTVAWHSAGRYLISGGFDHVVAVWTIPDLSPSSSFFNGPLDKTKSRSAEETHVIHYPHFMTSAVHSNFVDCVQFYSDLVLSKAAEENKIVLWAITNFKSKSLVPDVESAPKTDEFQETRNGFMPKTKKARAAKTLMAAHMHNSDECEKGEFVPPPYQRLLEFDVPNSYPFYMRFSLLTPSPIYPHIHPVLGFANERSKIFFWDLTRLELGHDGMMAGAGASDDGFLRPDNRSRKRGPAKINRELSLSSRLYSVVGPSTSPNPPSSPSSRRSSSITTGDGRGNSTSATSLATAPEPIVNRGKYSIHNPFQPIKAHQAGSVTGLYFTGRQAGWSACGRWCVVAGETGGDAMGLVFERWV